MMMSCTELIEIHRQKILPRFGEVVNARHFLRPFAITAPCENIHHNPEGQEPEKIPYESIHNVFLSLATPNAPR